MKYESASENHTIEEGHTHLPRLASPRTQRSSRAFAYFTRSTIPMEKTFFCVFLNLFIHSYFYMKTNFTYHLFASSWANRGGEGKHSQRRKKKEAIESFSCWRDLTIGFRFLVIIIDSRSFMSSVLRRVLTVLENTQHPMFNTGKDIQL